MTDASHSATTDVSLDLIQRFNKTLASNGVSLAVVMVPLKMRIYAKHLPDEIKINDYMASNYGRMNQALQAAQVNVIDLNTAFLQNAQRNSETPFFFRLDTHWTPTGALVAAEAVKAGIAANPVLKKSDGGGTRR